MWTNSSGQVGGAANKQHIFTKDGDDFNGAWQRSRLHLYSWNVMRALGQGIKCKSAQLSNYRMSYICKRLVSIFTSDYGWILTWHAIAYMALLKSSALYIVGIRMPFGMQPMIFAWTNIFTWGEQDSPSTVIMRMTITYHLIPDSHILIIKAELYTHNTRGIKWPSATIQGKITLWRV